MNFREAIEKLAKIAKTQDKDETVGRLTALLEFCNMTILPRAASMLDINLGQCSHFSNRMRVALENLVEVAEELGVSRDDLFNK